MRTVKKVIVATAAGFVIGAGALGATWVAAGSADEARPFGDFPVGQTGINEAGESYGPLVDFDNPPDLFETAASNGAVGYARWSDYWNVIGPAASLDEALDAKPQERVIPVYDKDGRTRIGEFTIFTGTEGGR